MQRESKASGVVQYHKYVKPWVGPKYGAGKYGKLRVLILGESAYDWPDPHSNPYWQT